MPQIIRTPEQIFREEEQDIYVIRMMDEKGKDSPAWQEIQEWLRKNTPASRVEMLAPPESSGWISGYFGDLRVDFTAQDLRAFCDRWEQPDGACVDPRFQCYFWPYQTWFEKSSKYVPSIERPKQVALTKWWEIPEGFVYHQIDQDEADKLGVDSHPAECSDIWFHAIRKWPSLEKLDSESLVRGAIYPRGRKAGWCLVVYCDAPWEPQGKFTPERQENFRQWFNLPPETEFVQDCL